MDNLALYITILAGISGLMYLKVSKFFGSMAILLLGMGLMYRAGDDGWIGFIVMACGFLMMIYSLTSKPKHR